MTATDNTFYMQLLDEVCISLYPTKGIQESIKSFSVNVLCAIVE